MGCSFGTNWSFAKFDPHSHLCVVRKRYRKHLVRWLLVWSRCKVAISCCHGDLRLMAVIIIWPNKNCSAIVYYCLWLMSSSWWGPGLKTFDPIKSLNFTSKSQYKNVRLIRSRILQNSHPVPSRIEISDPAGAWSCLYSSLIVFDFELELCLRL